MLGIERIEGTHKNLTFSYTNLKMTSEPSKRHSKLLWLIFILNCLSKTSVIGIEKEKD